MKMIYTLLILAFGCFISKAQTPSNSIDQEQLSKLLAFCDSTLADHVLIMHQGNIITDWKRESCDSAHFNTASMVKSWTGLVMGILLDQQIIESIHEPVCNYLPEWEAGCKNEVTIEHLLTMTAGINKMSGAGALVAKDINKFVCTIEPDTLPGIRYYYSNETVQLLGLVMEKATGKTADVLFEELLFNPMEMTGSSLYKDAAGNAIVFGGCRTTVEDAIKVGQLMLDQGKYQDKQIVSAEWIDASVTPGKHAPFYGYLWWIDNYSADRNFAATGDMGKLTIVFPDLDLVFVRARSCGITADSPNMTWMGPAFIKLVADVVKD